jgi:glycosyltransferase involved in cell wall biosynthesis
MTVVVATRDRPESLLRTLTSLADLDHERCDVVVVDSAPSDGRTRELLEASSEWPWPLRYVRTFRPGLAVAHNSALPWVTGEAVAFTDDDVVVDRHWLSALAAGFAEDDVQCVTGLLVPAELETPAQLWVEQGGGYGRGFATRRYSMREPDGTALFPFAAGRFGSGANMAFRTEWLARTGGFDPVTGAGTVARGGDDLVAFASVVLSGGALVYEPAAVVRHWHRREYQGLRRQAFGYGVGLGAYLAATLWRDPALALPMARRVGPAVSHVFSRRSDKNSAKRDYPAELTWRERAGMVVGPFAYAAGRWDSRRRMVPVQPAP